MGSPRPPALTSRRSTSERRKNSSDRRDGLEPIAKKKLDFVPEDNSRSPSRALRPIDLNVPSSKNERHNKKSNPNPPIKRRVLQRSATLPSSSPQEKTSERITSGHSISSSPKGQVAKMKGISTEDSSGHLYHDQCSSRAQSPVVDFADRPPETKHLLCPTPVRLQQSDGNLEKSSSCQVSHSAASGKAPSTQPESQPEEDEDELTDIFQQAHLVSLLLIGPPGAGKSSLMRNLIRSSDAASGSHFPSPGLSTPVCNSEQCPPIIGQTASELKTCPVDSDPPHQFCSPVETALSKDVDSRLVLVDEDDNWRVINEVHHLTHRLHNTNMLADHTGNSQKDALRRTNSRKVPIILKITDVSSRSEIHDTLPVLITNGSSSFFYVVVFKATESLTYQASANTTVTNKDMLRLLLSTIASFTSSERRDSQSPSPTVLVGTNRRSSKDGKLSTGEVDQLASVYLERDCPIMAVEKNRLAFEVDNVEDHMERFDELRHLIAESIRKQLNPISIHCHWLHLYSKLRAFKKSILPLSECQLLAADLGITDLHKVLEAFHRAGFLVHFSSSDKLKEVVIVDNQVMLDSIAKLKGVFVIENRALSRPIVDDFWKKGLFLLKHLEKESFDGDSLTALQLVALLQHKHIVAETKTKGTYFMCCALPDKNTDERSRELLGSSNPSPLLVQFNCQYYSNAFTCNLIAQLISKWSPLEDSFSRREFSFRAGRNGDVVTLLCRSNYYEVTFEAQKEREGTLKAACEKVYQELDSTISEVIQLLGVDWKHVFGFYCCCEKGSDVHSAFYRDDRRGQVIMCQGTNRKLTPAELMWFPIDQTSQSLPVFKEVALKDFLNGVAAKIPASWRLVGIQLGVSPDVLDNIEQSVQDSNTRYERVFRDCTKSSPLTWDCITKALKSPTIGQSRLADELRLEYSS